MEKDKIYAVKQKVDAADISLDDVPPLPEGEKFVLPKKFIIDPNGSVAKLEKMQFDPIERLVNLSERIQHDLNHLMFDGDGEPRPKFNGNAYSALMGIQQKIAMDLLRYGYKRVPEVVEINNVNPVPMQITLTGADQFGKE